MDTDTLTRWMTVKSTQQVMTSAFHHRLFALRNFNILVKWKPLYLQIDDEDNKPMYVLIR
jgi:hypothetical protein